MSKERLEAFSDGVFAFAITLLVLNITVPAQAGAVSEAWLWHELGSHWPDYISYATSFLVLAIIWTNHHAMFLRLKYIDRHTIMYNMLLLMTTVLIPFSTALLARYPRLAPSAFIYGLVLTLCSIGFNLLWWHVIRVPDSHTFTRAEKRSNTPRFLLGLGVYFAAMVIALFAPVVSIVAYLGITLYYFIPGGVDRPSVHSEG